MKSFYCLVILFLTIGCCEGQNIVPNPSFEDTLFCPTSLNQVNACKYWSAYRESPDYFNACTGISQVGMPDNIFGYQYAHTGTGYMGGLQVFYLTPNTREIAGCKLINQLTIGQRYYVSFYVNFGGKAVWRTAVNKIGVLFSTDSTKFNYPNFLPNFSQVYTDSVITDSLNWTFIKGSFIADSAYTYLGLGCFFDINNIDTINLTGNISSGYYFYDDICVSSDSTVCYGTVGINEKVNEIKIALFPNPFHDILQVTSVGNEFYEILIYDIFSRKIIQLPFKNALTLNMQQLISGIYVYEVRNKNEVIKKGKIIKE